MGGSEPGTAFILPPDGKKENLLKQPGGPPTGTGTAIER
jgi:hypothetical protein